MPLARWAEGCGAECGKCPLGSRVAVPPEPATDGPAQIWVVGEAPGGTEEILKRPLAGESGMYFNERVSEFEKIYELCKRSKMHITNAQLCRPKKHMKPSEIKTALKACSPRLLNELKGVPEGGLVMAMGSRAMQVLTGKAQVAPWRGYPLKAVKPYEFLNERKATVFPMFPPQFIMRQPAYSYVFRQDWFRALQWHSGDLTHWQWPEIQIGETGPALIALLEKLSKEPVLGLDVETAGVNPWTADLLCIGFGGQAGAVSVTWPTRDKYVEELVRGILADPKVGMALHNANFDKISLLANKLEYKCELEHDTLIYHRILFPLLRHDLSLVASAEVGGPRWKSLFRVMSDLKGGERFRKAKEDPTTLAELEIYNAKDSWMTWALLQQLLNRMAEFDADTAVRAGMRY